MRINKGGIINDFFEPNKNQYSIPVYQRNYEWSQEQCIKLFEDIVIAHKRDRYHFTGSVVFAPLKTENKINYYIIIDGQQRLTTVYILIKALIDMADTEAEKESLKSSVFNVDKFNVYNIDESSKMKLKPVKSDNQQLLLLMSDEIDEMSKSSGIYRNYMLFCDLIKKAMTEDDSIDVRAIYDGLEHLTCATIKLEEEDNAQEIFERINSTGVPLSLADKIRNFVLMTDVDQDRLYEDYWLKAENLVGYDNLTSFFLDFLNLKVDGFPKESEAYDCFKKVFEDGAYTNESMLKEILHYADFYHTFTFGDSRYGDKVNTYLAGLRKLNQTTVFVFLYLVFDDYNANPAVINRAELEKVLQFLLNYSIRRIMMEVSSNSLRGLYKTLYFRVFNRKENKAHYYDSIVSFFKQLTSRDVLATDDEFAIALKYNNLYRKNALCKYLLCAIENQGKEQLITDNLTIEHIMPQNQNMSTAWQKMLGEDWQAVKDKYLHTLGNLTLTGYNSELGDRPFPEKKELLNDVNTKVVTLYSDVKNCEVWNSDAIENRAKRLADLIINLFPIIDPAVEISFTDPRYQEYTCDDPESAKFKTPNYYILQGERVNVASYAEMLRSVIEHLYSMDSRIIEQMARTDECPVSWSSNVMFSYDETKTSGDNKIKGTDIYRSAGFSATHIMYIIRALLDKYDIDRSDFVYSAKASATDELGVGKISTAKEWCGKKAEEGKLFFTLENSQGRYVRFTTQAMNSIIPDSPDKLSPWKTHNFYFYEITNYNNALYVQLYFYCKNISEEMKIAFEKLFSILGKGGLGQGYKLAFKSTAFENKPEDTKESIESQLDIILDEINAFEADILNKWNL